MRYLPHIRTTLLAGLAACTGNAPPPDHPAAATANPAEPMPMDLHALRCPSLDGRAAIEQALR